MRFATTVAAATTLAAASAVQAAQFADTYSSSRGNFQLQAIYDSDTKATNFTLTSPATGTAYGWVGIGTGSNMDNSDMVVTWVADNQVVLSNRHANGEVMPRTTGRVLPDATNNAMITATSNSGTTVSWIQAGFPAANANLGSLKMIWANNPSGPTSTDPAAMFQFHENRGTMTLDFTKPYTPATASSSAAAPGTSSAPATEGEGEGERELNKYNNVVITHMVFMILGWLILFPSGVFIARFGRTAFTWFPKHRVVQSIGLLIVIIGMFLGIGINWTEGSPHLVTRHQKLGLSLSLIAVFQGILGQVGHMLWQSKRFRWQNYLHILIGVTTIPLSAWNMGEGLELWDWKPTDAAKYVLYAWTGFLGLIYIIGLAIGLPKEFKADNKAQAERAGLGRLDSSESVEKTSV